MKSKRRLNAFERLIRTALYNTDRERRRIDSLAARVAELEAALLASNVRIAQMAEQIQPHLAQPSEPWDPTGMYRVTNELYPDVVAPLLTSSVVSSAQRCPTCGAPVTGGFHECYSGSWQDGDLEPWETHKSQVTLA